MTTMAQLGDESFMDACPASGSVPEHGGTGSATPFAWHRIDPRAHGFGVPILAGREWIR